MIFRVLMLYPPQSLNISALGKFIYAPVAVPTELDSNRYRISVFSGTCPTPNTAAAG